MAQVNKRPGLSQEILPLAGTIVGAATGGPVGAAVGGVVGGKLAGGSASPGSQAIGSAIGSRYAATGGAAPLEVPAPAPAAINNPSQDLLRADQALQYMTPEEQRRYGPLIKRARSIDEQQTGVV